MSDKEEPELDLAEVVTAVHGQLGKKPNPSGLDLLTVLSRTHPELVNKLLLQQLLEKVIFQKKIFAEQNTAQFKSLKTNFKYIPSSYADR